MRRRGFISLIAGAVTAWPLTGHAQQAERVRRIGVLIAWPENDPFAQAIATAFAQALGRFGWIEGQNIRIDYPFAAGSQPSSRPNKNAAAALAIEAAMGAKR